MYAPGTNTGHGHVWERPDGMRARCGGPRMCKECAKDLADKENGIQKTHLKHWITTAAKFCGDND